jgi:mRNA interferase MazF
MKVSRSDVAVIRHPFSDASGAKVRPALVVQNDRRNAQLTETIIALITTNVRHVLTNPTQILIDLSTPDGKASGLNVTSALKCGKLFTIHEHLIHRKIGALSAALMHQANACLKAALGIP